MAKPRDNRQKDLLRPALEEIVDLGHPLVRLAREIDWGFLTAGLPACVRQVRASRHCRRAWWRGCSS
jgi:IS5 family transposase